MKNIFIGNIDFDTKEEDLRQLFASYGPVNQVTIVRDRYSSQPRGFGFVEVANVAAGEKTVAELDGTHLRAAH